MQRFQDWRRVAERKLPRFLFEYLDGAAGDEVTVARNREDLLKVTLPQWVLSPGDGAPAVEVLSQRLRLPVILGPVGLAGLYHRRGEVQAARAAEAAGVPFCLSTVGVCALQEVSAAVRCPPWMQLYMMRDRAFADTLMDDAWERGVRTLVLTVDMPAPGIRRRDYRSGLAGAAGIGGDLRRLGQALRRPSWAWTVGVRGRPHSLGTIAPRLHAAAGMQDFMAWMAANFDPHLSWSDVERVRRRWTGSLVIKGVLEPEDAERALDLGADGIVVSNHGGRQLDGARSTATALPVIAEKLSGRVALLADGGVRSGTDVARMMHLGADAVMLGRAWVYALAAGGELGVRTLLEDMAAELAAVRLLSGVS